MPQAIQLNHTSFGEAAEQLDSHVLLWGCEMAQPA